MAMAVPVPPTGQAAEVPEALVTVAGDHYLIEELEAHGVRGFSRSRVATISSGLGSGSPDGCV